MEHLQQSKYKKGDTLANGEQLSIRDFNDSQAEDTASMTLNYNAPSNNDLFFRLFDKPEDCSDGYQELHSTDVAKNNAFKITANKEMTIEIVHFTRRGTDVRRYSNIISFSPQKGHAYEFQISQSRDPIQLSISTKEYNNKTTRKNDGA